MELRHLRYFVAVAEELNFTRAQRCGTHQRRKAVTRGSPHHPQAGRGRQNRRAALRSRRNRADQYRFQRGNIFPPAHSAVIREFKTHYPDIALLPRASNTALLVARLLAGQIDVAFIRPPIGAREGVALEPLVNEPTVLLLPRKHPLSRSTSAPLSAVTKETFILFPRELNPGTYDAIISTCLAAGFDPKLGPPAPQIVSIIPMVAAGLGISIVPQSLVGILPEAVVYLPIEGDAPRALINLAYRRDDRSTAVQRFVAVARRARASNSKRGK
jgi:DNA-binding transcriptional LysR family regulator